MSCATKGFRSPYRTLVDLAAALDEKLLRTAVWRALAMRRTSIQQLVATRRRLRPRRGSTRLDRVLAAAAPTRSELEDVVFDLIVDAGFVRPDVNQPLQLAGRRVVPDFRWPEQEVVVEADSRTWHDNPITRADDAERQALLEAHGDRVVRITWEQAVGEGGGNSRANPGGGRTPRGRCPGCPPRGRWVVGALATLSRRDFDESVQERDPH